LKRRQRGMYKKIALATDGSEHSKRAAENAVKIAKCNPNSTIEVLYVVDPDKVKSEILNNWNSGDMGDIRKSRLKEVEKIAIDSGVFYEIKFLHGEPGPIIVDYVNKNKFDIVIIGSRGLNSLQEFVLGSVSHKVAKRANCPVLIVK
jgi:nucleotide-binding universal stress UspA family protein